MAQRFDVIVIGAGAAGLGVVAELARRGVDAEVLERSSAVGSSWRDRYEGLRLNTVRHMSGVSGARIPRRAGRWPRREDLIEHLEGCAAAIGVEPRFGVEVRRIDRADDTWRLETSAGEIEASSVVVATGHQRVPHTPDWPGRVRFGGRLMHSADYRSPATFAGEDVLVVGTGNSGTEIATQLAHGGAARVRVSMRTPVNLMPVEVLGVPITVLARLNEFQPDWLVDLGGALIQRLAVGDLSTFGMPRAPHGVATEMQVKGLGPVLDRGFSAALRNGALELVAAVEGFERDRVLLADGSDQRPDAVIAATGYAAGLEPLVGHLDVLDQRGRPRELAGGSVEAAPGLYFNGYWLPFSGELPAMRRSSRRIARRIARAGGVRRRAHEHPC